ETKAPEKETKAPKKGETKAPEKGETKAPKKGEIKAPEKETKAPKKEETKSPKKGEAKAPEKGETKAPKKGETKAPEKGETEAPEKGETEAPEKGETRTQEDPAEMEKNLILRFQIYESSQQNVTQVCSYWNRVQGTVQLPVIQKGTTSQPSAKNKGQKTNTPQEKVEKKPQEKVGEKPQEKVEKKPAQKCGSQRSLQSSQLETQSKVAQAAVRDKHVGVPCLDIQVKNLKDMIKEILKKGRLPTEDQMLKHLGLHPEGPPLPRPAVLSMVDYPAKTPDAKGTSAEGQPKTGKVTQRGKSPKENQVSTHRTKSPRDSSATRSKGTLKSASTPTEFLRLKRYRWIVPAHGEVELKVHFSAKKPGKFEQTLRFELVETKRLYELPCSGTGLYPSISQNPRLVFPQWRETMEEDEIIFKEYVESTKQFHFGPLLCGKSREWYVLPAGPCTF
ncbi:HYDIN protein, partial [Melanocharis versteri]|nr:HYDIN protein [Melanocharis versteri]